jgi:hypothetical protein
MVRDASVGIVTWTIARFLSVACLFVTCPFRPLRRESVFLMTRRFPVSCWMLLMWWRSCALYRT